MNMQSTPRRVALYARYTTDMQNPMSIEDQFRQCERYARQQGWTIVERFSDSAVSGTKGKTRQDFTRLSEALRTGSFDTVLTESLDRISRDPEHMAGFYKAARFPLRGIEAQIFRSLKAEHDQRQSRPRHRNHQQRALYRAPFLEQTELHQGSGHREARVSPQPAKRVASHRGARAAHHRPGFMG
ncbi:recombinase family protein [Citreimonas salinaria]|uniref:recombinase family protein n=1 Tax=Citreimonas salinaria TaxID=321339 RepID=UPI000B7EDB04